MSPKRALRFALVGDLSEPLQRLLEDVLKDSHGRSEVVRAPAVGADAAVVAVTWGEEARMITEARAQVGSIPLLAILPFRDDRLAELVLSCGAQAWFALDSDLALLRARLVALTDRMAPARGAAG
jgi:hypothetical protein